MLLALDVGNTHIALGVYDREQLVSDWRISTDREGTADEYGMLLTQLFTSRGLSLKAVNAIVIACVVPPLAASLEEASARYFDISPLFIGPGVKTGMPIKFDNPREVGADRIVNGVAAYRKYGGPAIVVDFGTATTFDAISAQGEYLGGAISPGIGIATDALFSHTAKLPRVELVKPQNIIGKNTVVCMQAGIMYGLMGQVKEIVSRMKKELGGGTVHVIATGGYAYLLEGEMDVVDRVDLLLTLEGLRLIYQLNVEP
ncbi:MAG TPA: type III pantothenate kinase [Clostridia bacterium]|nr:type III pantothenate kinase [Clostridia bacterium]